MSPWLPRRTAVLLSLVLLLGPPVPDAAVADGSPAPAPVAGDRSAPSAWTAPVAPAAPPTVLRPFDPPASPWAAGHRGADWAARPGGAVLSPGPGTIRFAGPVAGRAVVTVAHQDGTLSSLEPVDLAEGLEVGDRVAAGDVLGTVQQGAAHCPRACVHWGVRVPDGWRTDGGTWDRYLDPLVLLGWSGPSVLWPVHGEPPG
ncbi:M23 family metallopeptidase [Citricoccus sp. SGAir0253]|uniref:M23 family metallopeptidase n=1 Tax=Citricoccus sp. SGAir0253 TaxID=2567881 RepID=UPI0010CD1040|nr:M23 family metallopeptidase [Citricoccus sp. SGAir0253]QCU78546.1 M23 family metallopeptidase [Citricoccus sp. SGAir0253]